MTERRRILVVEDDEAIRGALEASFEDEGYEVRGVEHGRAALDLLESWAADLIVLDLMLPIMDGWVFLAERRRLGVVPGAKVVVVSAARQARAGAPADLGVEALVPKPFDLDTLLASVDRLLQHAANSH